MNKLKPEIKTINIGDAEIQYLYYHGGPETILFLHATGFLPWLWHPIAAGLVEKYSVIAPYFCDHRTADYSNGMSWYMLAEDLCRFCEKTGLERPFLVGHSMGGTIIAIANAIHGLHAKKMVMIEPIFLPEQIYRTNITTDQHPLAAKAIRRKNFWNTRDDAKSYFQSKPLFSRWDQEMFDLYLTYGLIPGDSGGLTLACPPIKEAALFLGSVRYNPWPILPKIECPVLVLEGESSENRPFIDLKKLTSLIPGGRYRLIKDTGHLIPMEKPDIVISILHDFFSSELYTTTYIR